MALLLVVAYSQVPFPALDFYEILRFDLLRLFGLVVVHVILSSTR